MPPALLWAALAGLLLLCGLLFALLVAATRRAGRRSRRRNRRALDGEAEAEAILADHGYRVVDRQHRARGRIWLDDEPLDFGVRVDLIVERDGEDFVAEVKTGARAPDPRHGPTRRQLREYAALFPDHGVLLVDVPGGRVIRVDFD